VAETLTARREEIETNFEAFESLLGSLLPSQQGRFAILHEANLVETFDSLKDAIAAAHVKFLDGVFSIQEVTREPLDLGFYSHARSEGQLR
jgi:hypothetical protein